MRSSGSNRVCWILAQLSLLPIQPRSWHGMVKPSPPFASMLARGNQARCQLGRAVPLCRGADLWKRDRCSATPERYGSVEYRSGAVSGIRALVIHRGEKVIVHYRLLLASAKTEEERQLCGSRIKHEQPLLDELHGGRRVGLRHDPSNRPRPRFGIRHRAEAARARQAEMVDSYDRRTYRHVRLGMRSLRRPNTARHGPPVTCGGAPLWTRYPD